MILEEREQPVNRKESYFLEEVWLKPERAFTLGYPVHQRKVVSYTAGNHLSLYVLVWSSETYDKMASSLSPERS